MDGHIDNYKNTATPATPAENLDDSWAEGFDLLAEPREEVRARKLADRVAKATAASLAREESRPTLAERRTGHAPLRGEEPIPDLDHEAEIQQLPRLTLAPTPKLGPDWVIARTVHLLDQCMTIRPVYKKSYNRSAPPQLTGEYTFDAAGAQKALNILARAQGMFTDKIEVKGSLKTTNTAEIDNRIRELITAFPALQKYGSIEHDPYG